jgi:hypothetical protein
MGAQTRRAAQALVLTTLTLPLAVRPALAQVPNLTPSPLMPGLVRTPTSLPGVLPTGLAGQSLPRLTGAPGTSPLPSAEVPAGIHPVPLSVVQAIQSRAHLPAGTPVPPTQEIEVLDPNVDPTGKPAVIPVVGPDGVARVDIPPTVLVHRYYYTGDRSFQGPLLAGGPTVLVLSHPADGERLYLQVQLPPGAPRVIYTRHSVEYNYGQQSVILTFGLHGCPKITYRQGIPPGARVQAVSAHVASSASRLVRRTGAPVVVEKVGKTASNVAQTAADRVNDVGKMVLSPVVKVVKALPGVNFLTTPPDQLLQRERDVLVNQAGGTSAPNLSSLGTVR